MVLTRTQLNPRNPFFNQAALENIMNYIETCDEVIHEAARGVLIAYERLEELKLLEKHRENPGATKDKMYLSFQERTRWPLFQQRVKFMMEALMNAKLDLTLQLLVYWIVWEAESRRK